MAAEPLMRLFFGEEFVPAAPALPVLGGAFVFICYGYLTGNMLLILGIAQEADRRRPRWPGGQRRSAT